MHSFVDEEQVSPYGTECRPKSRCIHPPRTIEVISPTLLIHHMRHPGLDIPAQAVLHTPDISIAHQYDMIAIDAQNAMHHIATAIDPGQYHITHSEGRRLTQDYPFFTSDDKGEHARAADGKRHIDTIIHQTDGLFYNCLIVHIFNFSLQKYTLFARFGKQYSLNNIKGLVESEIFRNFVAKSF